MPGTQVRQIRKTIQTEGVNKYSITAICVVAGDLPDTNIFVMTINTTVDPKDDTLLRIAGPADFTQYLADRSNAILAGDGFWRSATLTLTYEDIESADAAWQELTSRISALVSNFDTYLESFETPEGGTVTTYPVVDSSLRQKLIDAYKAAKADATSAEAERDDHLSECETLRREVETIDERLTEAKLDLEQITDVNASLSASVTAFSSISAGLTTEKDSLRTKNNISSATVTEKDGIESDLRDVEAQLNSFSVEQSSLSSLYSGTVSTMTALLQSRVTSLSADKNTKTTELNRCEMDLAALQGALDAARATRDAALADVLEACPDFDPSAV